MGEEAAAVSQDVYTHRHHHHHHHQRHHHHHHHDHIPPPMPIAVAVEAFEHLGKLIESGDGDLRLTDFTDSCSSISVLIGSLGVAFKFAEIEFISKLHDLSEASKSFQTLKEVVEHDVLHQTVRKYGSRTRNLRRVRQAIELVRALFYQLLSSNNHSLREAGTIAYSQVCAQYHSWAVRKLVSAGMSVLPSREQLLHKLNETEHTVGKNMKRYNDVSEAVVQYIDSLYLARNIPLDW